MPSFGFHQSDQDEMVHHHDEEKLKDSIDDVLSKLDQTISVLQECISRQLQYKSNRKRQPPPKDKK